MTMRPIMTRAELDTHRTNRFGRDYSLSDDGYSDMEVAEREGWIALSNWGRDGWELGEWPYIIILVRNHSVVVRMEGGLTSRIEMQSICEGDHDVYGFDSDDDRSAAIDYLFVWYLMRRDHKELIEAGLTIDQRPALDEGTAEVPEQFRGKFSWERLNNWRAIHEPER